MDKQELARIAPFIKELDETPRVQVEITQAAAEHVAAWDVDQRVKAVHEAGHAVAAAVLGIPIKAVDITSRWGGHTETGIGDDSLPETTTAAAILDQMVVLLAARAAEKLIIGQYTVGSGHDLRTATQMAYQRMSEGLEDEAPFISPDGIPFSLMPDSLGKDMYRSATRVLAECRDRAATLVEDERDAITAFATTLYARRRLAGPELDEALRAVRRTY